MQPSCPQKIQAWLSPALHWTVCILVKIHPSLSRTMTFQSSGSLVSRNRRWCLEAYRAPRLPGIPKETNNPRHMPAVTVCFVPLLLRSLGGLRCSTVSQGFSHVTSELIKGFEHFWCNSKWHLHTPAREWPLGYFTLLWLHVSSLPSKLEKSTDNQSPLTV